MPRVTRRSLASKKDEETASPAASGGRRGSKKAEPVEEPESIGEPSTQKTGRKGKAATVKEESAKGRTPSRGRGKKQEEPEEEIVESPAPKRGRGRGKKDEPEEKVEEAPTPKRGGRGGRGKKEEEPEEEESPAPKKPARGGRSKKQEEPEEEEEDEEESLPPPPKRGARGGRGKKEEEEESSSSSSKRSSRGGRAKQQSEEVPTPEKTAPKGRGRSARGARSSQPEEVNEEAEEEKEVVSKSPLNKTQSSGGRGRGKKEEASPVADTLPKDGPTAAAVLDEGSEAPPKGAEAVEDKMEDEGNAAEEHMEVESETKTEENAVEEENMEAEAKVESGKKRKLEDSEEEGSPKKARITAPEDYKDEDYVIVNKEDVPAADSKEVEAALPPIVEEQASEEMDDSNSTTPANSDDAAQPKMAAPSGVVPLTEAELAKQYNPMIRDKDENSSMMVEVGSEAASDVGSVSRNLDVSEMTAMDQAGQDDSIASSDVSELSTSSKPTEASIPSIANKIPAATESTPPQPPAVQQSAPVVEMASIPLPTADKSSSIVQQTEKASTVQPPAPTPVQSTPAPPSTVTPTPEPSNPQLPTVAPPVQLNSIPMPSDYNNSSSDSPSVIAAQEPVAQPVQNATAQNGSHKPSEKISESLPLSMSTPARKPIALDSSYVPSSPSITQRKYISNRSFPIELMDPAFCFSVVSYNILADCHLRRYDYSYTEAQYLELTYRHSLFLKELDYLDGDIVCLQEVDTKYYSDVLLPAMSSRGYQGMFKKRTQDWYDEGEAIFVKTSKFEVLSYDGMSLQDLAYEEISAAGLTGDVARAAKKYLNRADVVLVCKLLSKRTGKHLTVGNIHVAFDPKAPDVQCIQVASAVKDLVSKAGSDLNPYIICGDFNSETTSPSYQLAKDGYLNDEHIRVLQNIQSMDNTEGTSRSIIHYLWKAFQHTSSNMKSAYETTVGREPVITSMNGLVKACLDYIFYSSSTLYTVGAMEVIDPQVIEATGGLPSKDIPSDHLSVKAVFRLKD